MDFRHLIVTCLFSMLRLSFETQKIKENYAIFFFKRPYCFGKTSLSFNERNLCLAQEFIELGAGSGRICIKILNTPVGGNVAS